MDHFYPTGSAITARQAYQPVAISKDFLYGLFVMPIIKSAIKRARQSEVRRQRNLKLKSAIKRSSRAVLDDPKAKDAPDKLSTAYSKIDKAAKSGLLHKNTAARRKALLARQLAQSAPGKPSAAKTKPKTKPAKS